MKLSGEQRWKLKEALIDAFPNKSSLEQMLSFKLDKNLYTIAGDSDLQDIVFKIIIKAESENWIEDLINAALASNPRNTELKAIREELLTNPQNKHNNTQTRQSIKVKILILAALSHGLRLDAEFRFISECIRGAARRDMFDASIRTAVRPQDIRRAIQEEKPQIVHFCGHGVYDGSLVLEDDGGNDKLVSPQGLAALFEQHSDYVKCVVLNACYSVKTAEAISEHINYVIGMNQTIGDKAAIAFAEGFYDGLGYEQENNQDVFQNAFCEGLVAIGLEDFSQKSIPVLKKK